MAASVAPETPNPPSKEEKESMSTKFVKRVDARFLEYDKPLTLAILVAGITLVLSIAILVVQISTSLFEVTTKSASDTYPQYYGNFAQQRLWYGKMNKETTETEGSTETTVNTELCIRRVSVAVQAGDCQGTCIGTYDKSMPFQTQATGGQQGIPWLEMCWPGDKFMGGYKLDTSEEPAVWGTTPNEPTPLPWGGVLPAPTISFCPGIEATYYVTIQVPDAANPGQMVGVDYIGGTAIRALSSSSSSCAAPCVSELAEVTCPPVNNANGGIPWIVEYQQTVTVTSKIKPSLGDAIGIAFAYSTYIQVFFTFFILNVMLLCKCVKRTSEDGKAIISKTDS
jgi:hypothetical protein